jgi:hypothetical protein
VDPDTLEIEVVLEHDATTAMGAATVAVPHGPDLYLGSFASDRITKVRIR